MTGKGKNGQNTITANGHSIAENEPVDSLD
jgi:hypothetical protein